MGCVYFLRRANEDVFKIGKADCLADRMKSHSTTDPWLEAYGAIETGEQSKCEAFLHKYYEAQRVEGTKEFFRLKPVEVDEAIEVAKLFVSQNLPVSKVVEQLSHQQSESHMVGSTGREREIYRQLREVRQQEYRLKMRRELLENELKVGIGTAAGLGEIAIWKSQVRKVFDDSQLKIDNPPMHMEYLREQRIRVFRLF
jgi:excinuclease UvrABC nuclease subunit